MIRNKTLLVICLALTSHVYSLSILKVFKTSVPAIVTTENNPYFARSYQAFKLLQYAPIVLAAGHFAFHWITSWQTKKIGRRLPPFAEKFVKDIGQELGYAREEVHVRHTNSTAGSKGFGIVCMNLGAAMQLEELQHNDPGHLRDRVTSYLRFAIKHEFGHDQENHLLKRSWFIGTGLLFSHFACKYFLPKTGWAHLFQLPEKITESDFGPLVFAWIMKLMLTTLPTFIASIPYGRYQEQRADTFALQHMHNPAEVDQAASIWSEEYQNIDRNSWKVKYWDDPYHPCIFDRIDAMKKRAEELRQQEQARMIGAENA